MIAVTADDPPVGVTSNIRWPDNVVLLAIVEDGDTKRRLCERAASIPRNRQARVPIAGCEVIAVLAGWANSLSCTAVVEIHRYRSTCTAVGTSIFYGIYEYYHSTLVVNS